MAKQQNALQNKRSEHNPIATEHGESSSTQQSLMPPPFQLKSEGDSLENTETSTTNPLFSAGSIAPPNDLPFNNDQSSSKPMVSQHHQAIPAFQVPIQQKSNHVGMAEGLHNKENKALQTDFSIVNNHQNTSNTSKILQRKTTDSIAETDNQFYAHGAFMGAAPQLLQDSKWKRILQVLMPDVYAQATATTWTGNEKDQDKIIKMFENNPVTAAYGMIQTKKLDTTNTNGKSDRIENMKAFEWDAWFPDTPVMAFSYYDDEEGSELSEDSFSSTMKQLLGLSEYKSKEEAIKGIVDNMLIAHGALVETMAEDRFGGQYSNVRKTEKTKLGGVLPGAWMDIFGKALEMATTDNWEELADTHEKSKRHKSNSDKALDQTFVEQKSFQEVISLYKKTFGKDTFSVLLDIKSRSANPKLLAAVIQELNKRGVHVYGIGTFKFHETEGLSEIPQIVVGEDKCEEYPGAKEIKFFHYAGELQNHCKEGKIEPGNHVMFNAGSLISYDSAARGKNKKASYQLKEDVIQQISDYKEIFGFKLGLYVQEFDIDDKAANMLNEMANEHADVFDLGFSWGGISGETAANIEPSLTNGRVGTSLQGAKGKHWDSERPYADPDPAQNLIFDSSYSFSQKLRSRKFKIMGSKVRVDLNSESLGEDEKDFSVQLVREKEWASDDDKGKGGFTTGKDQTISWTTLSPGTYYINFNKKDYKDTRKIKGNIQVFQD